MRMAHKHFCVTISEDSVKIPQCFPCALFQKAASRQLFHFQKHSVGKGKGEQVFSELLAEILPG